MSVSSHAFEQFTLAFYNLENLFDYTRNKRILDADFTSEGRKEWTRTRYEKKLERLSRAISQIGYQETGSLPHILGVAEVENKKVLTDLAAQPLLSKAAYEIVHYDSPDERGIDVALLYNGKTFELLHSEPVPVYLVDENGLRDTTRDILYVHGRIAGFEVNIYVNHWPSRRDGADSTNNKRMEVANQLLRHTEGLDNDAPTIFLGDFNDDPENESVKSITDGNYFNATGKLKSAHRGTVNHKFKWSMFDQILLSTDFENDVPEHLYLHKANIFDDIMLRQWKGRYRGQPARTFVGNRYKGGYSDHFPVYIILRRN